MINEVETVSYTATIRDVNFVNLKKGTDIHIYTNEYNAFLFIPNHITKYLDVNEFLALNENQTIYFKVENYKVYDNNLFYSVVELSTEEKSYFTLDEYNVIMKKTLIILKVIIIVYSMFLIFIFFKLFPRRLFVNEKLKEK